MPARRRTPYACHLRVYEPVEHLREPARARWTTCVRSRTQHRLVEADQYVDSVRRLAGRPPVPVPPVESSDGRVIEVGGALYVCPQQPRLQVWHQLGSQDEELPAVLGPVLSPAERDQAAADLAACARAGGEVRLFTRTSTWQVPVAWFVPFAASERHLELADGSAVGERALRYRTAMSSARRRSARGLRAARDHLEDTDVVEQIEQVARWLEEFDPRSVVELDYAGLVEMLDDAHLRGDDSAGDVAAGLAALAEGDSLSAAAAYRRWSTRWQRVALLARAS